MASKHIMNKDLEFEVIYHTYPGSHGARERGTGLQLEPDEPPSVDITTVYLIHDGKYYPVHLPTELLSDWELEIAQENEL